MNRLLSAVALFFGFLPTLVHAAPVTWLFGGELTLIQKGSFDPQFKLGKIVDDEFVPTTFQGTVTFDPATFLFSHVINHPEATACAESLDACIYTFPASSHFVIDGHVINGGNFGYAATGPSRMSLHISDIEFDGTKAVLGSSMSFQIIGPYNHVLPADTLTPPILADVTSQGFFISFYPPFGQPRGTDVIGKITLLEQVPEPGIALAMLLSGACTLWQRRGGSRTRQQGIAACPRGDVRARFEKLPPRHRR